MNKSEKINKKTETCTIYIALYYSSSPFIGAALPFFETMFLMTTEQVPFTEEGCKLWSKAPKKGGKWTLSLEYFTSMYLSW